MNYWNTQLPLLVRYGFPLDFDRETKLESHMDNHTSAKQYLSDNSGLSHSRILVWAILDSFDSPPIKHLHISPFMTSPKPNGSHRRVIVDLNFPPTKSVNAGVCKDIYLDRSYQLTLPAIDVITNQVKALGRGCSLCKANISRAFPHIKLDPADYDLLGLCHVMNYVDTCLSFGFRHRSALCQ